MTGKGQALHGEPTDGALLPLLRRNDEAAFRILVRRYQAGLMAVARGSRLSPEMAEDVVQDAWIAAARNIGSFEGRSSLHTWLVGIVRNIARRARANGRRTVTFTDLVRPGEDGADAAFAVDASLADTRWCDAPWHWRCIDLERGLIGRQLWSRIEAAIAALPEAEAAMIRLRDVEGLGVAEIEALVGLKEARQRALLDRARGRIRRMFGKLMRDRIDRA